jgi:hypothetical protein
MILLHEPAPSPPPSSLVALHACLERANGQFTISDAYTLTARLDGSVRVNVHGFGSYRCGRSEATHWLELLDGAQ